jgi:hypothetical protein
MMRRIEVEDRQRLGAHGIFEDQQFDTRRMAAEDGEIEAVAAVVHPQGQGAPRAYAQGHGDEEASLITLP